MASFRDKTRSKNQWVNYSKSKYRRHCQGGCRKDPSKISSAENPVLKVGLM